MGISAQLQSHDCRVIVVTFADAEKGELWRTETQCPFEVISDTQKLLYRHFGLPRTIDKVWSLDMIRHYAEKKSQGIPLVPMYEDDDPYQIGGNFIVSSEGTVMMGHPSQTPTDRPSNDKILHCLNK